MRKEVLTGVIALCVGAIGASAKAIIDVNVLKDNKKTTFEILQDIKKDIREIRNRVYEINKRN